MKLEPLVSEMMRMSVMGRLWHWMTDTAQHHVAFEQFLTQNETLTDSLMESALGNEMKVNTGEVGVKNAQIQSYSIDSARMELKNYRSQIMEAKKELESGDLASSEELITILDDVVELCSKTVYHLKLK